MIKDRMVRVKLIKRFHEQRPISYVGKVTGFSENWVVIEGKTIMLARQQTNGVQVDSRAKAMLVPRENIESIQVLPDNFNMEQLNFSTEGQQLVLVVDNGRDSYIGELGEG